MRNVEFIAHRGSSYLAPENTLAAFRLGWQETTTCELDVRATGDGRMIVMHDETTLRTTGVDLVVARHSLAEIQRLDAGGWRGAAWKGEKVPALAEVIAAMPCDKRLLIEIKGGAGIIPELARVVRDSGRADALALQGFDRETCVRAKAELPNLPIYLLAFLEAEHKAAQAAWDSALAFVREEKLDGLGVNPATILDVGLAEIRASGLRLNIWTLDDLPTTRRFVAAGVDGIITNRPGWLREQLFLGD